MPGLIEKQPDGTYHIRCKICLHLIASEARSPGNFAPLLARHEKEECPATLTPGFWQFDNPITQKFTEDRMAFITPLLRQLRKSLGIDSALDVGCGLGDFSAFLSQFGIPKVVGIDGRADNIAEAQRRHVGPLFQLANAEELPELDRFDLVLCFGLVYHLENPLRALRKLQAVTSKVMLLDSMCIHAREPRLELMDEYTLDNQGLNYLAMYPSEPALVKMLRRSGFAFVYGFETLPDNEYYRASKWRMRTRTMMLAARVELHCENLVSLEDFQNFADHGAPAWKTALARIRERLTSS
jgi:SAM-dependent methyltransferase